MCERNDEERETVFRYTAECRYECVLLLLDVLCNFFWIRNLNWANIQWINIQITYDFFLFLESWLNDSIAYIGTNKNRLYKYIQRSRYLWIIVGRHTRYLFYFMFFKYLLVFCSSKNYNTFSYNFHKTRGVALCMNIYR